MDAQIYSVLAVYKKASKKMRELSKVRAESK